MLEEAAPATLFAMASEKEPDVVEPYVDPVVEFYKKDVDRTLLRENLKLSVEQRIEKLQRFMNDLEAVRGAARRRR